MIDSKVILKKKKQLTHSYNPSTGVENEISVNLRAVKKKEYLNHTYKKLQEDSSGSRDHFFLFRF